MRNVLVQTLFAYDVSVLPIRPGGLLYAIAYRCMPPRDWDASSYDRMSDPQLAMARDVIDRLDLRGGERVLDAGCGTGRVTAVLAERVPDGHVIAVDGSEAMVAETRKRGIDAFAV